MITYELYDAYGTKIHQIKTKTDNFETVIIEHGGLFYRPICYDLGEGGINTAKCVPVVMIHSGAIENHEQVSQERRDRR